MAFPGLPTPQQQPAQDSARYAARVTFTDQETGQVRQLLAVNDKGEIQPITRATLTGYASAEEAMLEGVRRTLGVDPTTLDSTDGCRVRAAARFLDDNDDESSEVYEVNLGELDREALQNDLNPARGVVFYSVPVNVDVPGVPEEAVNARAFPKNMRDGKENEAGTPPEGMEQQEQETLRQQARQALEAEAQQQAYLRAVQVEKAHQALADKDKENPQHLRRRTSQAAKHLQDKNSRDYQVGEVLRRQHEAEEPHVEEFRYTTNEQGQKVLTPVERELATYQEADDEASLTQMTQRLYEQADERISLLREAGWSEEALGEERARLHNLIEGRNIVGPGKVSGRITTETLSEYRGQLEQVEKDFVEKKGPALERYAKIREEVEREYRERYGEHFQIAAAQQVTGAGDLRARADEQAVEQQLEAGFKERIVSSWVRGVNEAIRDHQEEGRDPLSQTITPRHQSGNTEVFHPDENLRRFCIRNDSNAEVEVNENAVRDYFDEQMTAADRAQIPEALPDDDALNDEIKRKLVEQLKTDQELKRDSLETDVTIEVNGTPVTLQLPQPMKQFYQTPRGRGRRGRHSPKPREFKEGRLNDAIGNGATGSRLAEYRDQVREAHQTRTRAVQTDQAARNSLQASSREYVQSHRAEALEQAHIDANVQAQGEREVDRWARQIAGLPADTGVELPYTAFTDLGDYFTSEQRTISLTAGELASYKQADGSPDREKLQDLWNQNVRGHARNRTQVLYRLQDPSRDVANIRRRVAQAGGQDPVEVTFLQYPVPTASGALNQVRVPVSELTDEDGNPDDEKIAGLCREEYQAYLFGRSQAEADRTGRPAYPNPIFSPNLANRIRNEVNHNIGVSSRAEVDRRFYAPDREPQGGAGQRLDQTAVARVRASIQQELNHPQSQKAIREVRSRLKREDFHGASDAALDRMIQRSMLDKPHLVERDNGHLVVSKANQANLAEEVAFDFRRARDNKRQQYVEQRQHDVGTAAGEEEGEGFAQEWDQRHGQSFAEAYVGADQLEHNLTQAAQRQIADCEEQANRVEQTFESDLNRLHRKQRRMLDLPDEEAAACLRRQKAEDLYRRQAEGIYRDEDGNLRGPDHKNLTEEYSGMLEQACTNREDLEELGQFIDYMKNSQFPIIAAIGQMLEVFFQMWTYFALGKGMTPQELLKDKKCDEYLAQLSESHNRLGPLTEDILLNSLVQDEDGEYQVDYSHIMNDDSVDRSTRIALVASTLESGFEKSQIKGVPDDIMNAAKRVHATNHSVEGVGLEAAAAQRQAVETRERNLGQRGGVRRRPGSQTRQEAERHARLERRARLERHEDRQEHDPDAQEEQEQEAPRRPGNGAGA